MSLRSLVHILELIQNIHEKDNPFELVATIKEDLSAQANKYPPCIVGYNDNAVSKVAKEVTNGVKYPPFQGVDNWTHEHAETVIRSGLLLVITTARQLLPHTLVELLEVARTNRVPICLLIDGMDRTRDPLTAARGITRQLDSVLHGAQYRHFCLGDQRFKGPELSTAVQNAMNMHQPECRANDLSAIRAGQVGAWLSNRVEATDTELRLSRDDINQLRGYMNAMQILARSSTSGIAAGLDELSDSFRSIDPVQLINKAKENATGTELVGCFLRLMKAEFERLVDRSTSNILGQSAAEISKFSSSLSTDLRRSQHTLHTDLNNTETTGPSLESPLLPQTIKEDLQSVKEACLETVVADKILYLLAGLSENEVFAVDNDGNDEHDNQESQNDPVEKPTQEVENDERKKAQESGDDEQDDASGRDNETTIARVRAIIASAPEQLLISRLESTGFQILSHVQNQIEVSLDGFTRKWSEQLSEYATSPYLALIESVENCRVTIEKRLSTLVELDEHFRN